MEHIITFFPWKLELDDLTKSIARRVSIAVRALAYFAEDHGSGPTLSYLLDACSLSTHQRMGTWLKHWGDKGSDEWNWPPYLTKPMAQGKCAL